MKKKVYVLILLLLFIIICPKEVHAIYIDFRDNRVTIDSYIKCYIDVGTPVELYLKTDGQDEISTPYDASKEGFLVSNKFIPSRDYYFTRIKIKTDKGEEFYSFVEDGVYPYYKLYDDSKIRILDRGILNNDYVATSKNYYLAGEPIELKIDVKDESVKDITVFVDGNKSNSFPVVKDGNKYILKNVGVGSFYISAIKLKASDKEYLYTSSYSDSKDAYPLNSRLFQVMDKPFTKLSIEKSEVKLNEKLYLDMDLKKNIASGSIKLKNTITGNTFNTTIRDIDSKPYIVIPYTAKIGEYEIDLLSLTLKEDDNNYSSRKTVLCFYDKNLTYGKENDGSTRDYTGNNFGSDIKYYFHYDFNNYKLKIEKDDATIKTELLELDNALVDTEIINDIKKIKDDIEIHIDATQEYMVKKEVFAAIKGSNKLLNIKSDDSYWQFNGKNIKNSIDLDSRIDVSNIIDHKNIKKIAKSGVVIDFANDNKLPGNAKIRINKEVLTSKNKDNDNVRLYYYNEELNKYELLNENIKLSKDGYYEFDLSHTSRYILTREKISSVYLVGGISPLLIALIIAVPIVLIVIAVIVVLIIKNKKSKNDKDVVEDEKNIVVEDKDKDKEESCNDTTQIEKSTEVNEDETIN